MIFWKECSRIKSNFYEFEPLYIQLLQDTQWLRPSLQSTESHSTIDFLTNTGWGVGGKWFFIIYIKLILEVVFNFQLNISNNVYVFFKHLLTMFPFVVLTWRPVPRKQLLNRTKRRKMKIMVIWIVVTEIAHLKITLQLKLDLAESRTEINQNQNLWNITPYNLTLNVLLNKLAGKLFSTGDG